MLPWQHFPDKASEKESGHDGRSQDSLLSGGKSDFFDVELVCVSRVVRDRALALGGH